MNKIYKVSVRITGYGFTHCVDEYKTVKGFEGDMYFRNKYLAKKYVDEIYDIAENFYPSYGRHGEIEITNYGNYSIFIKIHMSEEEFKL